MLIKAQKITKEEAKAALRFENWSTAVEIVIETAVETAAGTVVETFARTPYKPNPFSLGSGQECTRDRRRTVYGGYTVTA